MCSLLALLKGGTCSQYQASTMKTAHSTAMMTIAVTKPETD